jgi:hypothetical protein
MASVTVQAVAGALAFLSAIAAVIDLRDPNIGIDDRWYWAAILAALGVLLMRPAYQRWFAIVDQEQREEQQRLPVSPSQDAERLREQEQRDTLRQLQDTMPKFSQAARRIYEEQRSSYLADRRRDRQTEQSASQDPDRSVYWRTIIDLDQTVLNLISRVENEKIRQAATLLYQLDRHMAYLLPSTWDATDLYAGRTPSFLMVDRLHQLTRMIGKVLRGESLDDEVVEDFVHRAAES